MQNGGASYVNSYHRYIDTYLVTYADKYYKYDSYDVTYETPIKRGKVRCSHCGYTYEGGEFKGESKVISRDFSGTKIRLKCTDRVDETRINSEYVHD